MDDLISRQAAIDAIKKDVMGGLNYEWIIKELPSIQPKQKTGRWIFEEGDGKTCVDGYICSACGRSYHTHVPYWDEFKFCPNCGAIMGGWKNNG